MADTEWPFAMVATSLQVYTLWKLWATDYLVKYNTIEVNGLWDDV